MEIKKREREREREGQMRNGKRKEREKREREGGRMKRAFKSKTLLCERVCILAS